MITIEKYQEALLIVLQYNSEMNERKKELKKIFRELKIDEYLKRYEGINPNRKIEYPLISKILISAFAKIAKNNNINISIISDLSKISIDELKHTHQVGEVSIIEFTILCKCAGIFTCL